MGFKSESAELQARIQLCKTEQDRALKSESEARKEVSRLTYANYELLERNKYVEKKYQELAARFGASQDDLDAIEVMMAKSDQSDRRQGANNRERNPSRLDKRHDHHKG
jgi:hypothetical protein